MNTREAAVLAQSLMEKYNLLTGGWRFEWSRAKKEFGSCHHHTQIIKLSEHLVRLNDEAQVRDTILHEIAHALVGRGHSHDSKWQLMAVSVGAKPEACYNVAETNMPTSRYTAKCKDCGLVIPRYKRPKTSMLLTGFHRTCKYKANQGKLEWFEGTRPMLVGVRVVPPYHFPEQVAANTAKLEPIKQDLTQSDIAAMWERLNKLEGK